VQDKALRVLFVGNSFTFTNEMPTIFAALAEAGGHAVTAELTGLGGWSLQTHAGSPVTTAAIREGWDIVVLQEQSRIPAVEIGRTTRMYPAARTLDGLIKAAGAKTMFFLTWGYREGDPEVGLPSYVLMQDQLTIGYTRIADELGASIAPVGLAWKDLRAQANPPNLWSGDGEHPSLEGSYLSACVFYATIYQQSPVGLTVTAGLRQDQALRLQTAAANAVLGSPSGLPEDAGSGIGAQPEE
jgi:hypothetical protein